MTESTTAVLNGIEISTPAHYIGTSVESDFSTDTWTFSHGRLPARFLDGVLIALSICALLLLVSWMQERDLETEYLTPRTTLANR